MWKSYILIALRKLYKEGGYVFINVLSLAFGITTFLLIALYLRSDLSYDQSHERHEQIYRVITQFAAGADVRRVATSPFGLGPLLVQDYPQLGRQVRFRLSTQNILEYQSVRRMWDSIYLADPTVFDIFSHKILHGDPKTAFDSPYSIALSASVARYYFGEENPVGLTLSGAAFPFKVTLVYEDLPENTHLRYDALLPMALLDAFVPGYTKNLVATLWQPDVFTYLEVPQGFRAEEFAATKRDFIRRYMEERSIQYRTSFDAELQPLQEVHFGEKLQADVRSGNLLYVYGFAAVACFTLLVACINYINLATARASKRAKEVGMRKVLGAERGQLIAQFLGESFMATAFATVLAMLTIGIALTSTPVGDLLGKQQLLAAFREPVVWLFVIGLTVGVALVAGFYPALHLSNISPLACLTSVRKSWQSGLSLRQVLVLLQFSISITIIACVLIMASQLDYLANKPLGFDTGQRLIVTLRGYDVVKNLRTIKAELARQDGVRSVTTISLVPGTDHFSNRLPVESAAGVIEPRDMDRLLVGVNFMSAMNVQVVKGRGFSEDIATDVREAVMVNESFVKMMGWDEPIGKRFALPYGPGQKVIGVTKDFHYASLHNVVGPLLIQPLGDEVPVTVGNLKSLVTSSLILVLAEDGVAATVERARSVVLKFDPNSVFEPEFLEQRLTMLYKSENNLMRLTGVFAAVCITIAALGLLGLAAFTIEQRTKEIGVRKVLGASDMQIWTLLARHALILVPVAAIPSAIASYYAMGEWLQRFAYRIEVTADPFVIATLAMVAVVLTTVTVVASKTLRSEPMVALRYE